MRKNAEIDKTGIIRSEREREKERLSLRQFSFSSFCMPPRDAEIDRFECNARDSRDKFCTAHESLESMNCCIWVLGRREREYHSSRMTFAIRTLPVMANDLRDDGKAFRSRGENTKEKSISNKSTSLSKKHHVKYDIMF